MSKQALNQTYHSIHKQINNAALSFQSKKDYKAILKLCACQLSERGFIIRSIDQLKQKHVSCLIAQWKSENRTSGTIKNRLSALRLSCELAGRVFVVKENQDYDIAKRSYVPTVSKAIKAIDLPAITDPYIRASLALQKEFGLRREESIKIKPHQAYHDGVLELQASWTKGGIQRMIPITRESQRICIEEVKALVKAGESLIPVGKTYQSQRTLYDNLTHKAGLNKLHGLRHGYAQARYEELTHKMTNGYGWKAPLDGGKKRSELNGYERTIDKKVRKIISSDLGHSRISITTIYIG